MNNDIYEMERKLVIINIKLEKEKRKRNIIMVALLSLLCGFFFSTLFDSFTTLEGILMLIVISLVAGAILYFGIMMVFSAVTDYLTNITELKDRKEYLEGRTGSDKTIYFDNNQIKKYAKGNLTDKDYKTILMCIDFSVSLLENEAENCSDETIIKNNSEKINKLNQVKDVFAKRSKPTPYQKNTALNCIYTYFDTMVDMKQLENKISDERKAELHNRICTLNSVIFKLELN